MKTCNFLEEYLKEDIISKIYRNECELIEKIITSEEYTEVIKKLKKKERELLKEDEFREYLEIRNIKDAIEAEEQFKLGFKLAVKIIIESYHS